MRQRIIVNPGDRYGRLVIVKEIENSSPRKFLCKCDCGQSTTVLLSKLRSKHTKSCGCLNREITSKIKIKDLTNQEFGFLKVIERIGTKRRNGVTIPVWKCKCRCGKFINVISTNLLNGNTTSCGCKISNSSKKVAEDLHSQQVDGAHVFLLRQKVPKNNSTGVIGVTTKTLKNGAIKYLAYITIKKKKIYLGTFDTLEEAKQARLDAEEKYHQPYIDKFKERNN